MVLADFRLFFMFIGTFEEISRRTLHCSTCLRGASCGHNLLRPPKACPPDSTFGPADYGKWDFGSTVPRSSGFPFLPRFFHRSAKPPAATPPMEIPRINTPEFAVRS